MLTRLKVTGFKNLVDVDVRFGPFTCVAAPNGVGKSNLFDAIRFLSMLADQPLIDAALAVRDEQRRTGDIGSLFHRSGDISATEMSFEAEMIVPEDAIDDLGQEANASITFLRYAVTLSYRTDIGNRSLGGLELVREELMQINQRDARDHLSFPHSAKWRRTAINGRRTSPFISTEGEGSTRLIKVHQEGSAGRPRSLLATSLPRTALSAVNAAESPTALVARREMQSWRLLQLEPAALRQPDPFTAPTRLGADGSHLPATLYHLARNDQRSTSSATGQEQADGQVYARIANRLAKLINDIRSVDIDRDERRELLTLYITDRDRTEHQARALSDGTLRFLALAVIELDPEAQGLICLEEPENGIHPERIPAMLQLLKSIATDVNEPISDDNPLRQVIINTHSPAVVQQVPDDSLIIAEIREAVQDGRRFKHATFSALPDTWRTRARLASPVARGKLLAYLNPVANEEWSSDDRPRSTHSTSAAPRVIDRPDMQQLVLPLSETST
jgi:predicted ATPase